MTEQPKRQRRPFRRIILCAIATPILLAVYVGGAFAYVYLDASKTINIDGPLEVTLEVCYWPLNMYSRSTLPGGKTLKKAVSATKAAGRQRRQ